MGQDIERSRVALIVEDDKELRALAVALLEETDLRVAALPDGRRGPRPSG
jgi:CheY-like chemotaxis protein